MDGGGSDDDKNDIWSWSEKQLQNLKAEHDRFFQNEGKRLEKGHDQQNGIDNNNNNPFSAFKRFVDSTVFGAISSSLDFRTAWKKEMERHQAEELDISYRWTGSWDSPDEIKESIATLTSSERKEAFNAAMSLEFQAYTNNEHVPADKIKALYNDPESSWGYLDLLGLELRRGDGISGTILERLGAQPRWLSVDWFKRSSYSPIRLEAYGEMSGSGHRWRAAFEDLLNASLDKPMRSEIDARQIGARQPFGKAHSLYCAPGLDWMLSLKCRGILPSRFPALSEHLAVLDVYNSDSTRTKWAVDGVLPSGTPMHEDVADLVKEVATRATGDTVTVDTPLTEHDLYDVVQQWEDQYKLRQRPLGKEDLEQHQAGSGSSQLKEHEMELKLVEQRNKQLLDQARQKYADEQQLPYSNPLEPTPYERWLPTGDREQDRWDAQDLLMDAYDSEDVKNAARVLNIWYDMYHDVDDLCQGEMEGYCDNILIEALRQSYKSRSRWTQYEKPDSSGTKEQLNTLGAQIMAQQERPIDTSICPGPPAPLSLEDQQKKEELIRKIHEILPDFTSWALVNAPLYNLEDILESLQQQRDCLDLTPELYEEQKKQHESWRRFPILPSVVRRKKPDVQKPDAQESDVQKPDVQKPDVQKPDVLSALTTTHTTRLPDGTVTTKVVLKKRFSDGGEETTESVHITNEHLEQQQQDEEQPKKKGWFWT